MAGGKHHPLSTRVVFLLTVAACSVMLAPTLTWDSAYDQGTFLYGGKAILDGARPYVDFWDIKPPNIFYAYSAALGFFGNSFFAVRLLDYLNALLTIALLFLLSLKLWTGTSWGRLAAVISSLAFVLQFYIQGPWNTAQTESYSLPWLLFAMLLVLPEKEELSSERVIRLVLAGLAIAIAFFFKFPNGIFLILILSMLWVDPVKQLRSRFIPVLLVLSGFLVGSALQLLDLWIHGGLNDLYHISTSSTAAYTGANYSGDFSIIHNLRTGLLSLDAFWLITSIIGWSLWNMEHQVKARERVVVLRNVILIGLACFLAFFSIQLQNKGYTYHYQILLPWADILVGAGIAHIIWLLKRLDALPRTSNSFIVLLVLFTASYVWTSSRQLGEREQAFAAVLSGESKANQHITSPDFIEYIQRTTTPGDSIFIFGFDPYLYWRSGRTPANKFLNTIHFKPSNVPAKERGELVQSLTIHPPKLMLVETGDKYTSQGDCPDDSRTVIATKYPEIERLLAERYEARDTIHGVIAYHLR
jgi:4-amino-4-deoxy-L-arabinose transferase-like glycosyltransferase